MFSAAVIRIRSQQASSFAKSGHRFSAAKPTLLQYQCATMYKSNYTRPADFEESDDLSQVERISLDDFYGSIAEHKLSDEEAL